MRAANCPSVAEIDAELRAIALQRQQLHARAASLLVRAEDLEIWRHFGCATFFEYLERFCDLHPRTAREYVRVARALHELPILRSALEAQRIVYSTARELTRIATSETECEWLLHVTGMTPREVEETVAGRKRGDSPNDPKDPDRTVKLVLEVRASTYAQFCEARTRYADARGEALTDDELVLAMCRADVLDEVATARVGDTDGTDVDAASCAGRAPHNLAITTCRSCARNFQIGGGHEVEVTAATADRARCDAQHLGDLEADSPSRITSTVSPRMRRHVVMRDRFTCCVPGCRARRFLDVHHIVFKSKRGSNKASNLITLCSGHHQQLHEQRLVVSGKAPHALTFSWPTEPSRISTRAYSDHADPIRSVSEVTLEEVARTAADALREGPASARPTGPRTGCAT